MKYKIFYSILILLLLSCNTKKNEPKQKMNDNFQNDNEWVGTYKGLIPCADCEGIKTELTLNKNYTFFLKTIYLKNLKENEFIDSGKFIWDKSRNKITIISEDNSIKQKYLVQENQLIMLDQKGNRIKNSQIDLMYNLKKITKN